MATPRLAFTLVVSALTLAVAAPAHAGSGVKKGIKAIQSATAAGDPDALEAGLKTVLAEGGKAAVKELVAVLEAFPKDKRLLYWQVVNGLTTINDEKGIKALGDHLLKKGDTPLATDLMFGLQNNRSPGMLEVYRKILKKKGHALQLLACDRLGEQETPEAVDLLMESFEKAPNGSALQRRIRSTLTGLFGDDMGDFLNWQGWWEQNRDTAFKGAAGGGHTGTVRDELGKARMGGLETMTRRGKVLVLRSRNKNFDSIEKMLSKLKVKHQVMAKKDFMADMDKALDGVAALILNCNYFNRVCRCRSCKPKINPANRLPQCSGCDKHDWFTDKLSDDAVARIRKFVADGGSVFTEDWGLTELTSRAWPDYVAVSGKLKEQKVDYAPVPGQAGTPLLRGVMAAPKKDGGSVTSALHPQWKVDDLSPQIKVVDPSKVRVLLSSSMLKDLAGSEEGLDAVALVFSPGEASAKKGSKKKKRRRRTGSSRRGSIAPPPKTGLVLHVLSHFGKQSSKSDEFTLQNLLVNWLLEAQERFEASKR